MTIQVLAQTSPRIEVTLTKLAGAFLKHIDILIAFRGVRDVTEDHLDVVRTDGSVRIEVEELKNEFEPIVEVVTENLKKQCKESLFRHSFVLVAG